MSRPLRRSAGRPRSKYGNRKTAVDGIVFDSAKEARRWTELCLLQKAGHINSLTRQNRHPLWFRNLNDELITIGVYVSDFDYFDVAKDETVTEDSKGVRLALYKWKARHFAAQYGRKILET